MMDYRKIKRFLDSVRKPIVVTAIAAIIAIGGRTTSTKAIVYPSIYYEGNILNIVNDVDSGLGQRYNIGSYLSMYGDVCAIPINLNQYSDGTLQTRIYTTSDVTGNIEAYIVEEKDLYSAKKYSGVFSFTYRNVDMGKDVQGADLKADGRTVWNSWMDGGKNYYLVLTSYTQNKKYNITDADGKQQQQEVGAIGYADVSIELVYEQAYADSANVLDNGKTVRKFMTLGEQDEQFVIKGSNDANSYTLYYTFDGERAYTGNGSVKVYNKDNELVAEKTVQASQANRRQELSLEIDNIEKGSSYTVRTAGICGFVTMRLDTDDYKVILKADKSTSKTNTVKISVDCGEMNVDNLVYVPWSVNNSAKDNANSFRNNISIEGNSFIITENGTYTVRAMSGGKSYIASIEVGNIDNEVPKLKKIPELTRKSVVLQTDATDLRAIRVNGRKVANGARLTEQGRYVITLEDKVGNVSEYNVSIDKTAPVISGEHIKNNAKLDKGSYLFKVSDEISGVASITIDGAEQKVGADGDTYSIYVQNAQHTIIVKDKAGNKRTITLKLKEDKKDADKQTSGNGSGGSSSSSGGSSGVGSGTVF